MEGDDSTRFEGDGCRKSLCDRADFQTSNGQRRCWVWVQDANYPKDSGAGPAIVIQPAMEGWREDGKVELLRKVERDMRIEREDFLHGVERDAMHGGENCPCRGHR